MATDINAGVSSTVKAATTSSTASSSSNASSKSTTTLADNFQTFLTLLTTQLQNQSPLDPLDTNQFTAQLVQFAQVEQQLKQNQQLESLVSLQKSNQQLQSLNYVGSSVTVDGSTAPLADGQAQWSFSVPKAANATIAVTSSTGQTVYTGKFTMSAGQQDFKWDGKGENGVQWPDGNYKMTVTATDATGQTVAVSTEVTGTVSSVDVSKSPPVLTIGGQEYSLDLVKRISRSA